MWHVTSFLILSIILVSCGLQKPAPALLKGEEFYGKRDLEYTREYHLIRDNIESSMKNEVVTTNKIDINDHNTQNMQISLANYKFMMPVNGNVISNTSYDEVCKEGVKIAAQGGTNVVASASGKVIYVGKGLGWYGNLIIVEHENNYVTLYSYLKDINVEIGSKIKQGQIIGSAGKSSTQDKDPQICFTIHHNGQAVNPLKSYN